MGEKYTVGLTHDGFTDDGTSIFGDVDLHRLEDAGLATRYLPPMTNPLDPAALDGLDAVLSFGHLHFDRRIAEGAPRLKHVARFGAGYDGIDLAGLAQCGVIVTNTPIAVRRPLALATLTMVLALAHKLEQNAATARSGHWAEGRGRFRGAGIQGRTLGIVGLGGVGREIAGLAQPLGFHVIGTDRPGREGQVDDTGVELVSLMELATRADYVVVAAALTAETHHLIGWEFLSRMRSSAYLVNTARGELVDPVALRRAVQERRIAGAGLDVFDPEPPDPADPLLADPAVVVTPHCLCWTEDFTRDVSASVIQAVVDVSCGRRPEHTLNPSAFEHARLGA